MSGVLHGELGSPDPRPRYDVLQPITLASGGFRWMRVGIAYRNSDGTIDAYIEDRIVGTRFRLREPVAEAPSKDGRADSKNGSGHGA